MVSLKRPHRKANGPQGLDTVLCSTVSLREELRDSRRFMRSFDHHRARLSYVNTKPSCLPRRISRCKVRFHGIIVLAVQTPRKAFSLEWSSILWNNALTSLLLRTLEHSARTKGTLADFSGRRFISISFGGNRKCQFNCNLECINIKITRFVVRIFKGDENAAIPTRLPYVMLPS